jgi:ferric-dicitrate binding protein FerR (iron transport regulator)
MSSRITRVDSDLDAWLAGSEAAGARLAASLRQREAALAVLGRLLMEETLRAELHARRRPRVLRFAAWSMLAAGLAAVLIISLWSSLTPIPSVELVGPGAQATRDGMVISGRLQVGDRVHGTDARLALSDGTAIALDGASTLKVAALDRSVLDFVLEDGAVTVQAAKQPSGRELRISTPDATVRVVGTSFAVVRWSGGSSVAVEEGRVVVDPADGGAERVLGAGDAWSTGLPRPALRLSGLTTFDGTEIWRELGALPGMPAGITIQVLARAEATAMGARLIGLGDGPWQQNINFMQWDTTLVLQVKQSEKPGDAITENQLEAKDAVRPGVWAVYEATIASDGSARIMRDGEIIAAGQMLVPIDVPRSHAWVARSFYDNPLWRGAISDLRVYPRALGLDESRAALRTFSRP